LNPGRLAFNFFAPSAPFAVKSPVCFPYRMKFAYTQRDGISMKLAKRAQYLRKATWVVLALGCCSLFSTAQTQPASLGTPDLPTSIRLKYAVLESRGDVVPCAAHFRQDRETEISTARQVFPEIQSNSQLLQLIAGHMNLNPEALGDDERMLVYCEYQKLLEIGLEPWKDKYRVIKIAQEQSAESTDQSQKGWTSVDLNGEVMSLSVQTLVPAVSSVPFRDIKPVPPVPVPPIIVSKVEFPKLRYQVLDSFPDVRYCQSRFENRQREIDAFSQIQADQETFKEISSHLHLKSDMGFSDDQKLLAYREYSKLTAVTLDFLVSKSQFKYAAYVGLINQAGQVKIFRMLQHNNCPL
jgi:hypothetical protein